MTTPDTASPATTLARTTTALITGANRGLGLETARRLAALGWTVWLGSRSLDAGSEAAAGLEGDVRAVALDVTDDASVHAARDVVQAAGTGLDVLINNAGVIGALRPAVEHEPADFLPAYDVNVLGPVRVTRAFLPLLTDSDRPRLVMVSSGLGSLALTNDPDRIEHAVPGLVYQSSKAALNMIGSQYARALPHVRVSVVDPGYTATEFNGYSGHQTVEEGTDAVVTAAAGDHVPGLYSDRHGALPW